MVYVTDTHAVVWFLEANPRLSRAAREIMASPESQLVIPTIALAEIAYLYGRGRVDIDVNSVLAHVAQTANCAIYPLDQAVAENLPAGLSIHDAIIAATAVVFRDVLSQQIAVITKDSEIKASGIVDVLW